MQKFWITFGDGHPNRNCYCVIEASNVSDANDRANALWGRKWSMAYRSPEDAGVERFELREIPEPALDEGKLNTRYRIVRALCLDMDGTIRYSRSGKTHINGPDDVAVYPDAEPVLRAYRNEDYLIALISNQGGVAHGFKTVDQVEDENAATLTQLGPGLVSYVFYCPFDPSGKVEPFNRRSLRRKPNTGMLVSFEDLAVANGAVIDWNNSLFVGDRLEDQRCAGSVLIRFEWAWRFFGRTPPPGQSVGHAGPGPVLPPK